MSDELKGEGYIHWPKVEKDKAKRPQPRTVWGFLDWKIAFSTVSGLEPILLFNAGREALLAGGGRETYRVDTSYTKRLSTYFAGQSAVE